MKQIYFSILLITIILLFNTGNISGQNEPGGLYLSGKITTEQGSVDGTIIKMTRNGVALKDYNVLPDGKFNLRFEFNNDYTLIFSRKDNFPQKIVISTQVPTDVLRRDRKFPPFPLDINLFTEVKGIEHTFSENAVLKIYYSVSVDNFISDIYYNNQQIKKLIDQAILQSQNVKKESDLLKRLSAAELAEMKKDYNDLLTKAGKEFDSQQYIPALEDYQAASRIFPEEQFPKDRIAEIKDLISVLGLQGELDAVLAKKAQTEAKEKAEAEAKVKAEADAERLKKAEAEAKAKADAEAERVKKAGIEAKAMAEAQAEKARIAKEKEDARLAAEAKKARLAAQLKARADSVRMAADAEKVKKAEAESKAKADAEAEKARIAAEEKDRTEAQKNQLQAKYQLLINEADKLADEQKLVEAVGKFRAALEVQPRETYPIQRIEEIRGIITKQLAEKKAYDVAVAQGDQAFGKKLYGQARTSYQQALQVKSGEKYPAVMIAKIDSIETEITRLATVAKAMEDSLNMVAEAERVKKAVAEAKAKAEAEAERLKKTEAEAKAKADVEAERVRKAEAEAKAKADTEAEKARIAKEKEDAKLAAEAEKARLAAQIKARTDSIRMAAEAQAKIKAEALAKAKADAEAERLRKADAEAKAKAEAEAEKARQAFLLKARTDSIRLAAEAQVKAKAEALAKAKADAEAERLRKADAEAKAKAEAEAEKARQAALLKARTDSIRLAAEAQVKAKAEALAKAKADAEAERLRKADAEAKAKAEAEAEKARQAALLKARQDSINQAAEAERVRKAEAQAKAKAEAEAVLKAKAEAVAQAKTEAEAEKARQAALQKARQDSINQAAEAERVRKAEAQAKANGEARTREAAEADKARIAKEKIISNEVEYLYNSLINNGDSAFTKKEYNVSRAWYYKALDIQPGKTYPLSRIEDIDGIIHSRLLSETDIEFQQYIDKGDEAFRNNQMAVARSWYNRALGMQPGDTYSKSQLLEIQIKIDENVRGNTDQSFKTYLEQGNKAFDQKQFGVAKVWYLRAQQLKPADVLVRQKLEAVQKAINGQ